MSILGITNRTENWKTAQYFAPLFDTNSVRLARLLLGSGTPLEPRDVKLELFWRGVRDYIHGENKSLPKGAKKRLTDYEDQFAAAFEKHFGDLRAAIREHGMLNIPKPWNYALVDSAKDGVKPKSKLASNLNGIEIDIVLETPNHILIGEAKDESDFGTDGNHVLVHQLIRQYVQVAVLLDVINSKKKVVPFIICQDTARIKGAGQTQFMLNQGWLREEHILSWSNIRELGQVKLLPME